MDKLSEYIPIIIILVSAIVGIIGKVKKQGRVTQEAAFPEKTVREYVEETKVLKPATVPYQKITEEKSPKQILQRHEIKPGKEIEAFASTPVIVEPEEESSFHFEEDDAVQAIIYAEIINRKEY